MTTAEPLIPEADLQMSPVKGKNDSFETESTTSNSDLNSSQNNLNFFNFDSNMNILKSVFQSTPSPKTSEKNIVDEPYSKWKLFWVVMGIFLLFIGRFNVPNNDVTSYVDNVLDLFLPINTWVLNNTHTIWPKLLLFCCATNMDLIFFATVYMWFKKGTTGRVLYSITIFYTTRALVQQFSYQPVPKGYYWDSPGFPSFVAPYGRSTDFFFSGHTGFLVLLGNEWGRNGYKKVQRYVQAAMLYTIFVLLACQAHYSIDIFTGLFFADYVFRRVDENKETLDGGMWKIAVFIQTVHNKIFGKKTEKKNE